MKLSQLRVAFGFSETKKKKKKKELELNRWTRKIVLGFTFSHSTFESSDFIEKDETERLRKNKQELKYHLKIQVITPMLLA